MAKRAPISRKRLRKIIHRHAVIALAALMVSQSALVSFAEVTPSGTVQEPLASGNEESIEDPIEGADEGGESSLLTTPPSGSNENDEEGGELQGAEGDEEGDSLQGSDGNEEGNQSAEGGEEGDGLQNSENNKEGDDTEEELLEEVSLLTNQVVNKATPSNATLPATDIFDDMPEIGTEEFEEWFFSHKDSEDLWEWVFELMDSEDEEDETVLAFLAWYAENEEAIVTAYQNFSGIATYANSTGDLWSTWTGDTDWNTSGNGTEEFPYEISELSDLCGLSELVAAGTDFAGKYFKLTNDINIGNLSSSWNPIGWYQNVSQLGGSVQHKFKGNFDGCGNTISGLKIVNVSHTLNNIGLFGAVEGGSIKNLTIEADGGVKGGDNVGILAGSVEGDTIIYNVTVKNSSISADGDAGGLVGQVVGDANAKSGTVTIENCSADGIVIQSTATGGYVGGIVGNMQKANIVDAYVRTYDGGSNRIQGQGYIGGIAGRINMGNIYNSYIEGTIGGSGSKAIGGIVGKYESGNIILARFDGTIANSNNGTASREGTFVGTRDASNNFTYGTGSSDNLSYLFTTNASMAKKVFGSAIDRDNSFTTDAHIGYWQNDERNFNLVAGTIDNEVRDKLFYEELEAAVKYIVISKLGNTMDEYWDGCDFKIDHFAPNSSGAPIRGYLVSIPRIDTRTGSGYDTDVATLTAIGMTSNSYYRQIDKDNPSAIAPGNVVNVSTAPKNSNGNRYQMVYDANKPGRVKPPTYTDEDGDAIPMAYEAGGYYTFNMPEADTELNVEYIKVTTALTMTPAETTIKVIQTRDGDRKNPQITTAIYDNAGTLIAKYIGDTVAVTPDPVRIHAEHNGEGSAADRTVLWSVDDMDLLTLSNVDTVTYTTNDARVMPNLNSNFIVSTINRKVQEQVDSAYANAIDNTIYSKAAVVTASTKPDTSVDHIPVTANTRVNVQLQIIDNTTRRVEGLNLSESDITITVTRKLTGDRTNPTESIFCDVPTVLGATLNPTKPFNKNVSWTDQQSGSLIVITPYGDHNENCKVTARYDANGVSNPQWIQSVIQADNQRRTNDKYVKLSGTATKTEVVTATSDDQTNGNVSATCNVNLVFKTVDETVIHPESISMSQATVNYDLSFTKAGNIKSSTVSDNGFETVDLDCTVLPDCALDDDHKPYNRNVIWSVSDTDALSIDQDGNITPNKNAQWIKNAMKQAPYTATKTVEVYATAEDNGVVGTTVVTLNYVTNCLELDKESLSYSLSFTKAGDINSETVAKDGFDAKKINATVYPIQKTVTWSSSDTDAITVDANGNLTVNPDAQWIKDAMKQAPYTATKTVNIYATEEDYGMVETTVVTLNYVTNCVELDKESLSYSLSFTKAGDINSETVKKTGFDAKKLNAAVYPTQETVTWSSSDTDAVKVDANGNLTVNPDAQWIKDAMKQAPYTATKNVKISAKYNGIEDTCTLSLAFKTYCVEFPAEEYTYNIELTKSGWRAAPTYTWAGGEARKISATPYPDKTAAVTYGTSDAAKVTITTDGTIIPVLNADSEWMKDAMVYPYTAATTAIVTATAGTSTDNCVIKLNIKVTDNTYSGSSSGGSGGGGGGGGGSSSSVKVKSSSTSTPLPSYVIKDGSWAKGTDGRWQYTVNNEALKNRWAAVYNPYADVAAGQSAFDWFRFDSDGFMVSGWFTDADGNVYYLHAATDGTQGRMYTGWHWITGTDGKQRCYYFNELSDGYRGKLMKNTTINDGAGTWTVNANGEWTVNGVVQVR